MIYFSRRKTKVETIVSANVSLHLRKYSCIVKKQSSLYKVFQSYFYCEGSEVTFLEIQTPGNLKYGTN